MGPIFMTKFIGHYDWRSGKVSGAVYCLDEELQKVTTEVYGLASYTNPLHSDLFPGVNKMEAEVVKMTANLFNGGPDACGTVMYFLILNEYE